MTMAREGATAAFGRMVAETGWETIAGQAHEAKRSLLNFLATASVPPATRRWTQASAPLPRSAARQTPR